ncbi:MAG: NAD-dependent succinate-semialdehyde dehydrogenase [Cyclobacteriaceae bacterium]|nr:NAD-dependent succinate-semialdehyde dehydrogenase [Cyclobacteriaceae bacterium]
MKPETLYINGKWVAASDNGEWAVTDPANEEIIEFVSFTSDKQDVEDAIEAAFSAVESWRNTNIYTRASILSNAAKLMRDNLDELARLAVKESGKPFAEARGEWLVATRFFDWFAGECKRAYGYTIPSSRDGKRMMTIRQSLGVVGIITAWNFPSYNPARSLSAALAAGCSVILKASEYTPLTAIAMVKKLEEAGLPKGVVNLINGEPGIIGDALLADARVRKISFTGSTVVGQYLYKNAWANLTRLSLELGGNAPVIITEKSDIENLAHQAVVTKSRNCGQVCVAPQRFILHESIAESFLEQCVEHAKSLVLGHGLSESTQMGPLINAKQRERLEEMLTEAKSQGVEILCGGQRPGSPEKGYFFKPTIALDTKAKSSLFQKEIFGPVMPVTTYKSLEEAVKLANQTEYGLAAYAFSKDLNEALYLAEKLEFGMVGINEWAPHATEAPFGGWKKSGMGAEGGHTGLYEYMEEKLISIGGLNF